VKRPDSPPTLDIADAAKTHGLRFTHIPVVGGAIGDEEVTAFRKALDDLPGPILGFCRTGTRTTTLWALTQAGQQPTDDILATAATAGYDLNGLRARLEATG
jgi:sulfide:quinone oxidoreductase